MREKVPAGKVDFSVIVPTWQRPGQLERCLRALSLVDCAGIDFEVIVVDDGGSRLEELVESFRSTLPVRLLVQKHGGPSRARNAGAAHARGDYLIFLDDDCAPAPDWLRQWDAAVKRWPAHLLGGATRNALRSNPWSTASQQLLDYLGGYYNSGGGRRPFVASNNLCVPAEAYKSLGGFSGEFPLAAAEDRDFCDLWLCSGRPIHETPGPVVYHAHELNFVRFWRQHFHYGQGAHLFHARSAARRSEPVNIEPLKFYLGLIFFPFRKTTQGAPGIFRAIGGTMLLVLSQGANVSGFFYERWRRKRLN